MQLSAVNQIMHNESNRTENRKTNDTIYKEMVLQTWDDLPMADNEAIKNHIDIQLKLSQRIDDVIKRREQELIERGFKSLVSLAKNNYKITKASELTNTLTELCSKHVTTRVLAKNSSFNGENCTIKFLGKKLDWEKRQNEEFSRANQSGETYLEPGADPEIFHEEAEKKSKQMTN